MNSHSNSPEIPQSPDWPGGPVAPSTHRGWVLAVLLLLLLAALVLGSRVLFEKQRQVYERAAQERLAAVADLKVAQIVAWRRERLANANYLRQTPYVARRALDALSRPDSQTTRQMFAAWWNSLFTSGPFEQLLLLDEQLNVFMTYTDRAPGVLSDTARRAAEQALSSREVVMADLERERSDGPVRLSLMVPLVVRREGARDSVPAAGARPSPADRSAAVLVLQINLTQALFPTVQSWPTPSPSAETLLVQRDGSEVVYWTPPRHRLPSAAPRSWLPPTNSWRGAAQAVRGLKGALARRDYRDVPVLALMKAVPGTAWSLVVKVDDQEIFAPFRAQAWTIASFAGMLLLAAALTVAFFWKRQFAQAILREITERKAADAERERLLAELRQTLAEVKTLQGIIPICAGCKKIRDDQGFWSQVETYVTQHSQARFSHGMCPDCLKEWYPSVNLELEPEPERPAAPPATLPTPAASVVPANSGRAILVVEPDPALRDSIRQRLARGGSAVQTVADGVQAIRTLSAHPGAFGWVVLEQAMPGMDGVMTLHALCCLRPDLRALLLTDGAAPALPPELRPNVRACLTKPFTEQQWKSLDDALGRPGSEG